MKDTNTNITLETMTTSKTYPGIEIYEDAIGVLYNGTDTVDFTINFKKSEKGLIANCDALHLEDDFYPVNSVEEWIEEYGNEFLNI